MAKSMQELIKSKQKEIAAKKGKTKAFKFPIGKTKIRILPSWRGGDDAQFWQDYGQHFIKDEEGGIKAVTVCADKSHNEECPVCAAIGQGIRNAHTDEQLEALKQCNAGQQYLMNVLIRGDATKKDPELVAVGIGIFGDICDIIEEYDDITDLDTGIDLTIVREGAGLSTKYTVIPAAKSAKVDKAVMSKVVNLDEYATLSPEIEVAKAIAGVNALIGLEAPTAPVETKSIANELADEIEDAELAEIQEELDLNEPKTEAEEFDIDAELDELLADV